MGKIATQPSDDLGACQVAAFLRTCTMVSASQKEIGVSCVLLSPSKVAPFPGAEVGVLIERGQMTCPLQDRLSAKVLSQLRGARSHNHANQKD